MTTPDGLPLHLYPDDVDVESEPAKDVERFLRGMIDVGIGLLDIEELDTLKRALLEPYVRDPNRRYPAQHEPETIATGKEIHRIDAAIDASLAAWDAAWAEIRAKPCPDHHWRNTDLVGRCGCCGEPLSESDPAD